MVNSSMKVNSVIIGIRTIGNSTDAAYCMNSINCRFLFIHDMKARNWNIWCGSIVTDQNPGRELQVSVQCCPASDTSERPELSVKCSFSTSLLCVARTVDQVKDALRAGSHRLNTDECACLDLFTN